MRFQHFAFIGCCLLLSLSLFSQAKTGTLSGTIVEPSAGKPVEFASVELFQLTDSIPFQTTLTDKLGRFSFAKIPLARYIIKAGIVGHETKSVEVSLSNQKQQLDPIMITSLPIEMKEVTVTSAKTLFTSGLDRKIYNVSSDLMAQTGSASDVLANIPSVEVNIDGDVTLRGAPNPMILVNGKTSLLMGRSAAEVLQQLPANQIERIEIITNPSARFRPDGTTGIINIVLKKNSKMGWSGAITSAVGNNERYNAGVNLNYKPGKLSLFANYNHREDRRRRTNGVTREFFDLQGMRESYYTESTVSSFRPISDLLAGGLEYSFNDRNSIGISGNHYSRKLIRTETSDRSFYDRNFSKTGLVQRNKKNPESETEREATIFWQHNFPQEDHELRIEGNFSMTQDKETHYNSTNQTSLIGTQFDNNFVREVDEQQEVSVEYTKPLGEENKIEAGYEGLFNQVDLDFLSETFDPTRSVFITDITRSNRFLYNERIHAFYGIYEQGFEEFGFSTGLRFETASINGNLVTKDSLIQNQYIKLYPSIHFTYEKNKNEFRLSYSKRVNRPDADELNPFPTYSDPYSLEAGNPGLLPEIIHAFEFGYKRQQEKFSITPTLYYRFTKKGFAEVTYPLNDTVLLTTTQNLLKSSAAGLELILTARPFPFLALTLSSNLFYSQLETGRAGSSPTNSIVAMSGNFNSSITLSKTSMWQISWNLRSARLTPQGRSFGQFVLNSGFRQDFFKKKVSATITVSDILKTLRQKSTINGSELSQVSTGRRDSRIFYLGVSYRFGGNKKLQEEKIEFEDGL